MERWVDARRVTDDGRPLVRDLGPRQQIDEGELDPPDRAPQPARE
jgi:hypothetical protein